MTSHWMRSTPAFSRAAHSSPSREKSAGSTEGTIEIGPHRAPLLQQAWAPVEHRGRRHRDRRRRRRGRPPRRRPGGVRAGRHPRRPGARSTSPRRSPASPGPTSLEVLDAGARAGQRRRARSWPPGCGGCGWQHVEPAAQRRAQGARSSPTPSPASAGSTDAPGHRPRPRPPGHRVPHDGAGRRRRRRRRRRSGSTTATTSSPLGDDGCLVAHPLVDEVLRRGRFAGASEVTVRAGVATGERLALVDPTPTRSRACPTASPSSAPTSSGRAPGLVPRGGRRPPLADLGGQLLPGPARRRRRPGRRRRPPAVQPGRRRPAHRSSTSTAASGCSPAPSPTGSAAPSTVQLVEASRSAVADARVNLADLAGARVVRADVRQLAPVAGRRRRRRPVPPRPRRRRSSTASPRPGPRAVVLVSCDPGALGRDAGLLAAAGYRLGRVTLVDLFPHTPHVEVVTDVAGVDPIRAAAAP